MIFKNKDVPVLVVDRGTEKFGGAFLNASVEVVHATLQAAPNEKIPVGGEKERAGAGRESQRIIID